MLYYTYTTIAITNLTIPCTSWLEETLRHNNLFHFWTPHLLLIFELHYPVISTYSNVYWKGDSALNCPLPTRFSPWWPGGKKQNGRPPANAILFSISMFFLARGPLLKIIIYATWVNSLEYVIQILSPIFISENFIESRRGFAAYFHTVHFCTLHPWLHHELIWVIRIITITNHIIFIGILLHEVRGQYLWCKFNW